MKELYKILGKNISTILISLGLATIIIASIGHVPFVSNSDIGGLGWKIFMAIVGTAIVIMGLTLAYYDFTKKRQVKGKKTENAERKVIEIFRCTGTLLDTNLGENEEIIKMPSHRVWTYELSNIIIKIYSDQKLSLEYDAVIHSRHSTTAEIYKSYGCGSFKRGVAHIVYKFSEKETGSPSWRGSMVLNIPKRGTIIGYWITTNIDDSKFPIGIIKLKRQV